MAVLLLDKSLEMKVFLDKEDTGFEDNICLQFIESCPDDEKVFIGGETNLYITRDQARAIIEELKAVLDA